MKFKIFINKTNIKKGVPRSFCYCPVSLALQRTFRKIEYVSVDQLYIGLTGIIKQGDIPETYRNIECPNKVGNFISKFDSGKKVKPFSFILEIK